MLLLLAPIVALLVGGWVAWLVEKKSTAAPRIIAHLSLLAALVAVVMQYLHRDLNADWWLEAQAQWIPRFGMSIHLAVDGMSWVMLLLTVLLGFAAVEVSKGEIKERVGFFHFNLLWNLAGVLGVFVALDLMVFFAFWEIMLVPMYLLIAIWGHERRQYASLKFFIFTQASGLLMLVAIIALAFAHFQQTGVFSFDYEVLKTSPVAPELAQWLMWGFFIAFAVKLPALGVHTWLPDAHTQAPTGGSVILAGILLKTGAYGLLRFCIPLFPEASAQYAYFFMMLGAIGAIYGAVLAFAQNDIKRLIAYSSVSHMGFVLVGAYAWNELALQGVVMQMVAHGLSTGGLFLLAGMMYQRLHTRDIREMGGLWQRAPEFGAVGLALGMASLGLPFFANFNAEILTLMGAWQVDKTATIIAASGIVGASIYVLIMLQRVFFGTLKNTGERLRFTASEWVIMLGVVGLLVALGLGSTQLTALVNDSVQVMLQTRLR